MLSCGLLALWGENLLTIILAWAVFDLAWGTGMVAFGLSPARILWRMGGGVVAIILLWMSSLVLEGTDTGSIWSLMVSPQAGIEFLFFFAALVRLGAYPFPSVLPVEGERKHPLGSVLFLEPILAWSLLVRIFGQARLPLPIWPWLEWFAVGTFIIGGLLALTAPDGARSVQWAGLSAIGGILWAGIRATDAQQAAAIWLIGGTLWTLGISLLYLGRGWERPSLWWIGTGVGTLALSVTPLLGGASAPLIGWTRWVGFFLGQAFLVAALLRDALRPSAGEESGDVWLDIARAAGLGIPAALIVIIVLLIPGLAGPALQDWRPSAPGWPALVVWILGILVGSVLFRALPLVQKGRSGMTALHTTLKLDWAYDLIAGSFSRGAGLISAVADVVEGAGAVLWALAVFLLILVVVLGL